jgi:hypothetical protein
MERPLPVVDSRSNDLYWGARLRSNDIMLSDEQFTRALDEGRPVAISVMNRQLAEFRARPYAARFGSARRIGDTTLFMN